jgi:hypothetical protein
MIPQPTNPQFEHEARTLERERQAVHEREEGAFDHPHNERRAPRRWWQFWRPSASDDE